MSKAVHHVTSETNSFFPLILFLNTGIGFNSRTKSPPNTVIVNAKGEKITYINEKISQYQLQVKILGYSINVLPAFKSQSSVRKTISNADGSPLQFRYNLPTRYDSEFEKYLKIQRQGKTLSKTNGNEIENYLSNINSKIKALRYEVLYEKYFEKNDKELFGGVLSSESAIVKKDIGSFIEVNSARNDFVIGDEVHNQLVVIQINGIFHDVREKDAEYGGLFNIFSLKPEYYYYESGKNRIEDITDLTITTTTIIRKQNGGLLNDESSNIKLVITKVKEYLDNNGTPLKYSEEITSVSHEGYLGLFLNKNYAKTCLIENNYRKILDEEKFEIRLNQACLGALSALSAGLTSLALNDRLSAVDFGKVFVNIIRSFMTAHITRGTLSAVILTIIFAIASSYLCLIDRNDRRSKKEKVFVGFIEGFVVFAQYRLAMQNYSFIAINAFGIAIDSTISSLYATNIVQNIYYLSLMKKSVFEIVILIIISIVVTKIASTATTLVLTGLSIFEVTGIIGLIFDAIPYVVSGVVAAIAAFTMKNFSSWVLIKYDEKFNGGNLRGGFVRIHT